jgi:four helix bundle protein
LPVVGYSQPVTHNFKEGLMGRNSYEDLEVWQRAMDLVVDCYDLTRSFPKTEQFGLTPQLQRAAVSVPANIAEGQARQHTREFLRYLTIARGSLAELETHVRIAERLGYAREDVVRRMLSTTDQVGRMISGLCKSLRVRQAPAVAGVKPTTHDP